MKYKFSFIWDKCAMADHMLVSCSVLRNCQITFHGGYATLYSHVQRKNDLIFLHPDYTLYNYFKKFNHSDKKGV